MQTLKTNLNYATNVAFIFLKVESADTKNVSCVRILMGVRTQSYKFFFLKKNILFFYLT
jgi:hypothetical protein